MFASLLLVLAAESAATTLVEIEEPDPKAMSQADIRKFNAQLTRSHPYYIRCEQRLETGSLVKKLKSCRTNEQWQKSEEQGNDTAREAGDAFRPKSSNQSG